MKTVIERLVTPPPLAPPPIPSNGTPEQRTKAFVEANLYQKTFERDNDSSSLSLRSSSMQHVTVHPSQSRVAYCLSSSSSLGEDTIVVQDYQRGSTLFAISLSEIKQALVHKTKTTTTNLGSVQKLDFCDAATLFYSGMTTFARTQEQQLQIKPSLGNRLQALVVQFHQLILILNIRPIQHRPLPGLVNNNNNNNSKSDLILAVISESTLGKGTPPTTNLLLLTPYLVLVGCMDGTLRIMDIRNHHVVKSVRGPAMSDKKKDYLVHLLPVNPSSDLYSRDEKQFRRFVAISHKGIAILWEYVVANHGHDILDVRPPVARMEGHTLTHDWTTTFSWKESSSNDNMLLSPSSNSNTEMSSSTEHHSFMEHLLVSYDEHRNLLFWFVPTGYKGPGKSSSSGSRPHLICWNLSIRTNKTVGGNHSIPKHDPLLIVALPKDLADAGRLTLLPGWLPPAFSDSCITCALGTHRGDVAILSCSTDDDSDASLSIHKQPNVIKDPAITHYVNIGSMFDGPVHIHSLLSCQNQDSSCLMVNTNFGLVSMRLEPDDGFPSSTSSLHQYLLESEAPTDTNNGSVLWVQQSSVFWAPMAKGEKNPVGYARIRSGPPQVLYQSPTGPSPDPQAAAATVRLPPRFLKSPSHLYVCLFWQEEQQYEVLHLPSLLQRRRKNPNLLSSSVPTSTYSPAVATGKGISSFAWVGNDDHFALLYPAMSEQEQRQTTLLPSSSADTVVTTMSSASSVSSSTTHGTNTPQNKDHNIGSSGKSRIRKSFNFNKIEKVMHRNKSSNNPLVSPSSQSLASPIVGVSPPKGGGASFDPEKLKARIEIKALVGVKADAVEYSGSIAAATATTLGYMELRNRHHPPTTLFGGPVLCVASHHDRDGAAQFYTRKASTTTGQGDTTPRSSAATDFIMSGPTLPYPDLVEWNEDGRLCAVVSGTRVFVYFSEEPNFTLLGTSVLLGSSPMDSGVTVTSLKFVRGVLYCATNASVQCIILGNLDDQDAICHLDSFLLASKDVSCLPSRDLIALKPKYKSWSPPTIPMSLNHPSILGYQRGSLLLSTVSGLHCVPLRHPLVRIGSLLGAGDVESAQQWLASFPASDHEALAAFLDRRGLPEMAMDHLELSVETMVDFCFRYRFTDRLEQIIETHGLESISRIDMGRGLQPWKWGHDQGGQSMVVCVGAYLLAEGRIELVRQMATESMASTYGKRDAFALAALLVSVDPNDAGRLMKRVVNKSMTDDKSMDNDPTYGLSEWPVATLIREKLLR